MLKLASLVFGLLLFCALFYGVIFWILRNPPLPSDATPPKGSADPTRLEADVRTLAASEPARAFHNVAALDQVAKYIEDEFAAAGCKPERQTFEVDNNQYHNIRCSLGPASAPKLVIGAHCDVAGDDNPGADDNAGAVAGILELTRLINSKKPDLSHRVDLVAYTLEEPPNFKTQNMGSYVYAERLTRDGADVRHCAHSLMMDWMICWDPLFTATHRHGVRSAPTPTVTLVAASSKCDLTTVTSLLLVLFETAARQTSSAARVLSAATDPAVSVQPETARLPPTMTKNDPRTLMVLSSSVSSYSRSTLNTNPIHRLFRRRHRVRRTSYRDWPA